MLKRFICIFLLGCLAHFAHAQVNTKYKTSTGDGYDGSRSKSFVWEIYQPAMVCVGEDALLTMQVKGSLLYSFRWYEVGKKGTTLSKESFYLIENCQAADSGRRFVCEVVDLNSGQKFETEDTFRLVVKARPAAKWLNTLKDTTICSGQKLKLKVASDQTDDLTVYTWFGAGVVGAGNRSEITVMPESDTRYSVTVSNGTCASEPIYADVHVKSAAVKLPQDIIYANNGQVTLAPSAGEGGTLDWFANGNKYANQSEFTWNMPQDVAETTVKVTRTVDKCSVSDSVVVINELAMQRFVGGDNDGFIESIQKVSVSGITPVLSEVCAGEEAYFTCNVGTIGTFTYQWYRLDESEEGVKLEGATNSLLILETKDDPGVAGQYYCVVYDLDTKQSFTTDPATLVLIERPEVSIVTPDTAICKGGQMVLRADREAEDGEIFRWNGLNIQTNPTLQEITVAPTETAVYQLVAMKGTCLTTEEVRVEVRDVQVHLPDVVDVLLGDEVTLGQPHENRVRYVWTQDGTRTPGDTLSFIPNKNTIVYLEKSVGDCKAKDSTQIYLKEYGVGLTDESIEDGFAESVLPFYIKSIECPERLCRDDEAILDIEVNGYDVYSYTWKKRLSNGSTVIIDTVQQHIIPKVSMQDSGTYFCEVRDWRSGKVLVSDEVRMEVLTRPVAVIRFLDPPAQDRPSCTVCAGTMLTLEADQAKGLTYLWDGIGLLGATDKPKINALPESTTDYSLVVSNGVCSHMVFATVNVLDISVDIPEMMIVHEGEPFEVVPSTEIPTGAQLAWKFFDQGGNGGRFASNGADKSGYLKVSMTLGDCEASDSTRIYVRGSGAFSGGAEDGFVESNSSFVIQELHYPAVICENGDADFSIRVKGSGIYSYNWKQVGSSETLSTESVFSLGKCTMDMFGDRYYCQVTDLMLGKTLSSDTISLNIKKGPKAVIGYPERGKSYCSGTKIRLDARETENFKESEDIEYVYSWEGQNVTATESSYAVDVKPTASQVYTLKVSTETCSSYDTIHINVINPRVMIPSVIYAKENDPLSITAEVANASVKATINWWHNALFKPNVNPFVINSIAESANVVAEIVDGGCKYSDTARVYVRTNRFFVGGDDDGFMESCNIPEINPDIPTVLGCGGVDSVEMNVSYTGEPKTFVWQRYEKNSGKFVAVGESDQLFGLGTPTLKIKPLTEEFYGQYRCVLSNDCGSTYSLTYRVSNGNAPQVAVHRDTVSVCEGVKDHPIVMVLKQDETVGEVSYRWYRKNPVTGVTVQYTPESAFNKNEFLIPEVTPEYDALYLKEAENVCGIARDSVRLIVDRKVSFKLQPQDTVVCYNGNVTLRAYSQDGGICTYTLKKVVPDNSLAEGYRIIKRFKTSPVNRYEFKPALLEDNGYYVWTVKSLCGDSITSRMFNMKVEKPVQFLAQTPDTAVCLGTVLALNVQAESPDCPDSKITYEWSKLSEGKLTYQTPSISMNVEAATSGFYLCSATNVCGTQDLVKPIEVTIHPQLLVTQNPVWSSDGAGICEEQKLELNFAVNRMDIVDSIRWYRREQSGKAVPLLNEGIRIAGADDYALQIDSIRLEEAGHYYAKVYNVCGVFETRDVKVDVDEKAKVLKPIGDFFDGNVMCKGEEVDLRVRAAGKATLIYTWEKNDVKVSEDSVLRVTFDEDAVYTCSIHNYCNAAVSRWSVTVVQPDTFRFKAVDATHYCEGGEGVRLLLGGSDPECTYSLYRKAAAGANPELVQVLNGGDAYVSGGSLDFGIRPAGLYYVMAHDPELGCDGRMPGEVTVVMDSLPKLFELKIGYPICEGNATGTVVLDSSQNSFSGHYQYSLEKQESGGWQVCAPSVSGNGRPLVWENVPAGLYRVNAVDRETRCARLMDGIADLSEHPNPQSCDLVQYQGDTVYCEGQEIKVGLRMNAICFAQGQNYTLMKDGKLAGEAKTDNGGWGDLQEGEYAVVVKNEWGCADTTNTVRIVKYPLPARKSVGQNRFYCDGEVQTGETALITVSNVDEHVKYAFYRKGGAGPIEEVYKGAMAFVSTEVSLTEADYYVVATDTATGCSVPMNDTVQIRGSHLELSYTPITMDRSENPVRLNLTVKNAVGRTTVKWEPENQIQEISDPLHPWVDMTDLSKNVFTVTVKDTVCEKTERIVISMTGQALTANIKTTEGTDVPNDTLWVCEGAAYSLDGEVLGGREPFGYDWSMGGASLGNKRKLTNAVAKKSGYLVFRVGSNGRIAKDSIWLAVHPAPGKGIRVNTPDVCVSPGDVFAMNLSNVRQGVSYTLEYSTNKDVFRSTNISFVGDASGNGSLERPFTEDKAGYYRIQASYGYGSTTCTSLHDTVRVGAGVYKTPLHGGGNYCSRNGLDSLVVDTTVVDASYWLVYSESETGPFLKYDAAGVRAGDGDTLFFVGDYPSGYYRMAAQRKDASCVDTMPGKVRINHLDKPAAGKLISDQMEYCITPESSLKVTISLSGAVAGNTYKLYRQNGSSVELLGTKIVGRDADFTYGTGYEERGRYFSVADNGACRDTAGYVLIGRLPEGDIEIARVDTGYCAGNTKDIVRLNVYPVESDVHYYIYPEGYWSWTAECGRFVDDSVQFAGALGEGNYIIKAKVAECEKEIGRFNVAEYPLPDVVDLMTPNSACEGTALTMGVKASQAGMAYEIFWEKDAKHIALRASKNGDGSDLTLWTSDTAGTYHVQARDLRTGCIRTLESYSILANPKDFNFIASDTVYCAFDEESGTMLGLSGTENGVVYVLQRYDDGAGKFEDVKPQVAMTGTGSRTTVYFSGMHTAGKYRVRTTTCEGSLIGNELEIRELSLPADTIAVDLAGNGCVDSTMSIHLRDTETGVTYSLWKGEAQVLGNLTGGASDLHWTVNAATQGTYEVRAVREGASRDVCAVALNRKVKVETLPLLQDLQGESSICRYTTTRLEIPISDQGVKYTLHVAGDTLKVADGAAGQVKVLFNEVKPGAYYAVAAKGDCRISTSVFSLDSIPVPDIDAVRVDYTGCIVQNGGQITVSDLQDTLNYFLVYPGGKEERFDYGVSLNKTFDNLAIGEYYLKVRDKKTNCYSLSDTLRLNNAVPSGDTLSGAFGYCEGKMGARLKLNHSSQNIKYMIKTVAGDTLESIFGGIGQSFQKYYVSDTAAKAPKEYVFVAERQGVYGGCRLEKRFWIDRYASPDLAEKLKLQESGALCAGSEYHISVVDAKENTSYVLYRGKLALDTVKGSANPHFKAVNAAGDYTVVPKTGGICGNKALDTLFRLNALPAEIFVDQPLSYCNPADATEEKGAALRVYNTAKHVRYVLTDGTNALDTLYGDVSLAYQEFDKMPAGTYTITGTDSLTGCSRVVASAEIKKNSEPQRFVCGVDGMRCDTAASVELANSQTDVSYYLHRNGVRVDGPIAGTDGDPVSFGKQTEPGIYQISAVSKLGCSVYMKDSVLVYAPLLQDTLVVRGSYCEGGESDIAFRLRKQSALWKYFIVKAGDLTSSDTLNGTENTVLMWTEVGGKDIRGGKYRLCALNPCGDLRQLDSVIIDTNRLPLKYPIAEGDFTVCAGDSGTITLSVSQAEAEYDLMFRPEEGAERCLATKSGTGNKLELAKVDRAGTYTVIGRMKATGCTDTVAEAKVTLVNGIQSPGITASDVCLTTDPGASLEVRLQTKHPDISYYLQRIHGHDTVRVDSIRWGIIADAGKKAFAAQSDEGIYQVVAQGPTCRKVFSAAMVGSAASDQRLDPSGTATICGGDAKEIGLQGSELGVQYEVYKVNRNYYDTTYVTTNIVADGTGNALKLGALTDAGFYVVKASNGCTVQLKDTLKLNVDQAYKIQLRESYTICGADDSVRIEILGRTNPTQNAQYVIYEPGAATFTELLVSGSAQASIVSDRWYKKPGFYRVQGIDITGCPEMDSVEIKVLKLPDAHPFVLKGDKYLCNSSAKKELVVEGAQEGVDYHLYRVVNGGAPEAVTMKSAQKSDFQVSFSVTQEGTYYVVGQYNDKGRKACPVRMDGEIGLEPVEMHSYALESVCDRYCEGANIVGEVRLNNSDANVVYQLYQDGIAFGAAKEPTVSGVALTWENLPGGIPKMSANSVATPMTYTVKAKDKTTGCEANMNGSVEVFAERPIVYSEELLQNTIPACLGGHLNMLVGAYGGKIAYQWSKDGASIDTARHYYYIKDTVTTGDIGTYHCDMTNTCGTVRTPDVNVVPALLTDRPSTGIDTIVVCDLKADEMRAVMLSSRTANADRWEWFKDGVLLEDEEDNLLEVPVSVNRGAGVYTCKASNSCGFIRDTCVVLVDSTPRMELLAPLHRDTLCAGAAWELQVNANQPVAWWKGTQPTAYTGNTMRIDPVRIADRGTYFAVAENRCGVAKTEVATLVVDTLIEVISKQEYFHVCRQSGELPHLFVQTEPRDRVYYRWEDREGNVLGTGNELNNIDLKKYTALVDTFRVYYGNRCEDSYKDMALVTSDFIQFRQPVEGIGVCVKDMLPDTVVRVEVLNEQQVTYTWFKSNRNDNTVVRDSVGDADTLKIRLNSTTHAGYYYCYIANRCVDTVSKMVNVRIDTIPHVLKSLPQFDTLCSGSEMKQLLTARAGSGSLKYTWHVKKKGLPADTVAHALYFGESTSEYKCIVDETYDGALVWCDVSTYCSQPQTDTLHLTVLPALKLEMNALAARNCEGKDNEIYVKLAGGEGPWQYKYSVDGKENAAVRSVTGDTDTLKVSAAGVYRIYWLADGRCTLTGKELAAAEFSELKRSKFTLEAVGYNGPACPDSDQTLRVKISGGLPGPWNVAVRRMSDGELASELGLIAPIYTSDSVYTWDFKLQKNEEYFAEVSNIYGDQECDAETSVKSVALEVFEKPEIRMKELEAKDRILSVCNNVSLDKLFDVQPKEGGWYIVDGEQVSGDWLLEPDKNKYAIGYRIYQGGCVFGGYNLGDIELRPRPSLDPEIFDQHVLCGGDGAVASFQAEGETPIEVTYRIFDMHKNGTLSMNKTVTLRLPAAESATHFLYDENLAGKIIEVLRVEDKYKCLQEEKLLPKDTLLFPGRPEFELYTKHSDSILWKLTSDSRYRIQKGKAVDLRVNLSQGYLPWTMFVNVPLNREDGFEIGDIPTRSRDTAVHKAGFYEIDVVDKYCGTDFFAGKKKYVEVKVIDTAYVKLKAYLQGPWNDAAGKMESSVLNQIEKRGLAQWPNVGSRKIIDWVVVELWREESSGVEFWEEQWALLLDDGTIVDKEGNANLKLMGKTSGSFRVAIRPRNHLATWSCPVDLSATTSSAPRVIDFTTSSGIYVENGEAISKYVMTSGSGALLLYGGEVNANRLVTSFDPNRVTREVLTSIEATAGTGALLLDVNYNGHVEWPGYAKDADVSDWAIMYKNRSKYSIVPERAVKW